ncbi:MAG: diaminopimelate epimerase [Clostridiaceae bacterium]|nr:diaminopimelate epimerase [Clostridiaceae bacterium]
MKFTKMHGLGNDYIFAHMMNEVLQNPANLAKKISDRHFGVGSDGLVLIMPSKTADAKMRIFNADGSEAEMCGNAVRCVGKYLFDNGIIKEERITLETLAGIKILELRTADGKVSAVRVDMGQPVLEAARIPVISSKERFIDEPIEIDGSVFRATCVSMGNPHAVIFTDDVSELPVHLYGPRLENHSIFPNRTNVEFVRIVSRDRIKMRVWERGAGETLACGTGACASVAAAVVNGLCGRRVTVMLPGGELLIEWDETNGHIYKTGPAVKVFDGEIEI